MSAAFSVLLLLVAVPAALVAVAPVHRPSDSDDPAANATRIVGGTLAHNGQFPFVVSLLNGGAQRHFCAATIISQRWTVTAAHCVHTRTPNTVLVRSGSLVHNRGGRMHRVAQIRVHQAFVNEGRRLNDVALVQLADALTWNVNTQPIALDAAIGRIERPAIVMGWGFMAPDEPVYPDVLQQLTTKIISDAQCQMHAAIPVQTAVQLCTNAGHGRGICQGDTGGPLVSTEAGTQRRLLGIISSAVPCATGRPDVYTRVAAYADWIGAVVAGMA